MFCCSCCYGTRDCHNDDHLGCHLYELRRIGKGRVPQLLWNRSGHGICSRSIRACRISYSVPNVRTKRIAIPDSLSSLLWIRASWSDAFIYGTSAVSLVQLWKLHLGRFSRI